MQFSSNTVEIFISLDSLQQMKMRRRFRNTLEEKANELAAERGMMQWNTSIPSMLRREIALTVDQLEQIKFLTKDQMRHLLRQECDINTSMKQFRQGIPWYTASRFPEEQKLKQRLFDIEKERRKLDIQYHDKRTTLEDRLLSLINKHEQIDIR
jgi:hypothetical protein